MYVVCDAENRVCNAATAVPFRVLHIGLSHATVTLCTTDLLLKPAQPLTIDMNVGRRIRLALAAFSMLAEPVLTARDVDRHARKP